MHYLENDGRSITRTDFDENLAEKIGDEVFLSDVPPLIALGVTFDPPKGALNNNIYSRDRSC